jgi:hypothetical protein
MSVRRGELIELPHLSGAADVLFPLLNVLGRPRGVERRSSAEVREPLDAVDDRTQFLRGCSQLSGIHSKLERLLVIADRPTLTSSKSLRWSGAGRVSIVWSSVSFISCLFLQSSALPLCEWDVSRLTRRHDWEGV